MQYGHATRVELLADERRPVPLDPGEERIHANPCVFGQLLHGTKKRSPQRDGIGELVCVRHGSHAGDTRHPEGVIEAGDPSDAGEPS